MNCSASIERLHVVGFFLVDNLCVVLRGGDAADMELPRTTEKSIILDFIKESDKGIIRGPQGL